MRCLLILARDIVCEKLKWEILQCTNGANARSNSEVYKLITRLHVRCRSLTTGAELMKSLIALEVISLLLTFSARAQSDAKDVAQYPTKTIRMLVGFSAGGGTDATARLFAQKMSDGFGQNVVVDNRVGAGGDIAADLLAKAVPDGHTLLMT